MLEVSKMHQTQYKYILYIICKKYHSINEWNFKEGLIFLKLMEFEIKVRTIFPLRVNEFLIAFKFQCQADMAA